jgi:hypothetical protein
MSLVNSPSSNGSQTASQLIPPASKLAYHERSFPSCDGRLAQTFTRRTVGSALGEAARRRIYGVLSHNPSTLPSESLK